MKLAECKMGTLVCMKPDVADTHRLRIGHVIGLMLTVKDFPIATQAEAVLNQIRVKADEPSITVPLVLFAGSRNPVGVHYDHLDLFTEF